jgi:hypothetical protein
MNRRYSQILLLIIFTVSCSPTNIIGYWERKGMNKPKGSKQGNLSLFSDSTFLINGVEPKDTSTVPGWHVGEEMKGRWTKATNNRIILYPDDREYFLAFKIVQLHQNKMILTIGSPSMQDKANLIKYERGKTTANINSNK